MGRIISILWNLVTHVLTPVGWLSRKGPTFKSLYPNIEHDWEMMNMGHYFLWKPKGAKYGPFFTTREDKIDECPSTYGIWREGNGAEMLTPEKWMDVMASWVG